MNDTPNIPLTYEQRRRIIDACLENLSDQLHDGAYDPNDFPNWREMLLEDLLAVVSIATLNANRDFAIKVICDDIGLCTREDESDINHYIDGTPIE